MKVIYLLGTFPSMSETFIVNEIIELRKLGHEIKILAHYHGDVRNLDKVHENIIKYKLLKNTFYIYPKIYPKRSQKYLYFLKTICFDLVKKPLRTLRYSFYIFRPPFYHVIDNYFNTRKLFEEKFDLIHVQFSHLNHLYQALCLSKIFKKPFTITFRAVDLYGKKTKRELRYKKSLIKKASKIITISQYNKENLTKKFRLNNIEVIHSSINTENFKPIKNKKTKKIISICRFVEKKGIEHLIKALDIVKRKINFNFILIGEGPLKDKYERLIKKYDLEGNITIKQALTQKEIKKELNKSMIFILPCVIARNGDRDILPNVLKEAMAMEIPVITSSISGIKELVEDEKTGILVPPKNAMAIANAILKLFENKTLRKKMGKQGRKKIKKDFNVKIEAKKIEKIFKEAISHFPYKA